MKRSYVQVMSERLDIGFSALVFTAAIMNFLMWHSTLIKLGSLARESSTREDNWGIFST
jgi:hypothetical protein